LGLVRKSQWEVADKERYSSVESGREGGTSS